VRCRDWLPVGQACCACVTQPDMRHDAFSIVSLQRWARQRAARQQRPAGARPCRRRLAVVAATDNEQRTAAERRHRWGSMSQCFQLQMGSAISVFGS